MKEQSIAGNNPSANTKKITGMVLIAAMAAVICVLAPFSLAIPFSPVHVSLTNLVLYVIIYVEGWKRASASYLVYLLVGLAGMPVFSGFGSGFSKLLGPSGGYLIGMIFMTIISGYIVEKTSRWYLQFAGMVLGTAVNYTFGTAWMAYSMELTFKAGLAAGVIPFVPVDLIKMALACVVGNMLRKRLAKSGLLEYR